MTLSGFIWGLIMSVLGFLILRFRVRVRHLLPRSNWFERKLAPGATYTLLLLSALLLIFFGLMTMFGATDDIFRAIFGDFF